MQNLKTLAPFLLFVLLFPILSFCQDDEEVEISTEKITENIYALYGRGGNLGLCVGDDGAILIDDQYAPLTEKISAAIAEITDKPVKFLINTHWHGDHTGGNENFGKKGAIIFAQENVRNRMSKEQIREPARRNVPASPKIALPVITFKEDLTFHLNGEDILVFHIHNAHTDGDAIVYFPQSNVVHMGDTFFNSRFPFIDLNSGGGVEGMIRAANKVLFLADDATKIIPGHGKVGGKQELRAFRDMLITIRDRVKKAIKNGKSLEEIKTAGLTEGYEDWGSGFINSERFLDILYSDLGK